MFRPMISRALAVSALTLALVLPAAANPFLAQYATPVVNPVPVPPSIAPVYNPADQAIEGTVVYPGGSVAGLSVQLFVDGSGQAYGSGTTNAQGFVSIPYVAFPHNAPHTIQSIVSVPLSATFINTYTITASASATYTGAGTVYYVSPTGSDSNNGTSASTPWQTIAKVNAGIYTPNDSIEFQGGQSFTGCFGITQAKVPNSFRTNLFSVLSYGGNGNATITSNCGTAANGTNGFKSSLFSEDGVSGFMWSGVNLVGSASSLPTQYGIALENNDSVGNHLAENMTVQNSDISGFQLPAGATTDSADEIVVTGYGLVGYCGAINNINVLNNTLHGASVTANDDNGIGGYGCGQNIFNVTYQGNKVFNEGGRVAAPGGATGNGMTMNAINGGVEQYNVVHDNGANTVSCGGPGGVWAYNSNNILTQFNEVYYMRPTNNSQVGNGNGCDWIGFDTDGSVTNNIVQYNYSHNNAGPGFLDYTTGGPHYGDVFRYNISVNDNFTVNDAGGSFAGNPDTGLQIYNNTIVRSAAAVPAYTSSGTTNSGACFSAGYNSAYYGKNYYVNNLCWNNVANTYGQVYMLDLGTGAGGIGNITDDYNIFYNNGGGTSMWRGLPSGGSIYSTFASMQSGTGQEAHSLTSNPLLTSVDTNTVTTCGSITGPQPCPAGYQLGTGSPAIGAGEAISALVSPTPVRDYYGNGIPATGVNIGAWQTPGTPLPPILATLSLSPLTAGTTTPYTGTITGKTTGSTITASSSDGTVLTVNGAGTQVTGQFTVGGSPYVGLVETLAGAQGSPKTSGQSVVVSAPNLFTWDFTQSTLPSGVTASGGVGGTATNAAGNIVASSAPRSYFSAGARKGVMIEPASTNLITQSATPAATGTGAWGGFSNGSGTSTTTANSATSPDGTVDAVKIAQNRTSNGDWAEISTPNFSGNSANTVASAWIKADTAADVGKTIYMVFYDPNASQTGDFVDGVTETLTGTWARVSIGGVLSSSAGCGVIIGYVPNSPGAQVNFATTGAVNYDIWNTQVEQNAAAPTSDIITTTAPVTRTADTISGTIPSGVGHLRFNYPAGGFTTIAQGPGAFTIPAGVVTGQPALTNVVGSQ